MTRSKLFLTVTKKSKYDWKYSDFVPIIDIIPSVVFTDRTMCTCPDMYCMNPPVWTPGSPEVRRKQVPSFLLLSLPLVTLRDHFSLGERGWVRLQPSSSERATFASPFCLESDKRTKRDNNINAKAFITKSLPWQRGGGGRGSLHEPGTFSAMKFNLTELWGKVGLFHFTATFMTRLPKKQRKFSS